MTAEDRQTVTVLGGNGFIGGAVVSALVNLTGKVDARSMVRDTVATASGRETRLGDVTDISSVRSAVRGSRTVVHAATYIGSDPSLCQATNVDGTRNVAAACAAEGVARIIYVSTAAVYGCGPHRGASERDLERIPESVLSRSRAAAEDIVLAAGGISVRPDLIVGAGDRWFVPGLIKFVDDLGGLVDGGAALVSAIHVNDVGTIVARLAASEGDIPSGPFNVAYPAPTSISEVVSAVAPATHWDLPLPSVSLSDAAARARAAGYSDRQFALLAADHWYDSTAVRRLVDIGDVDGLSIQPADLAWYRAHLAR